MISKALVVGIYQRKCETIAARGVELLTLVPPSWKDERGETSLERVYTNGYRLETIPIIRNGDFHLHFYRELDTWVNNFQPDILHIDEEPYNLSAWQGLYHARRTGAKSVLFSWQNLDRHYPPPFSWGESRALKQADALIAGTESAANVWRHKGYQGKLPVIAQFGTDGDLFRPAETRPERPFTIGYFGRLVEEKGVNLLLEAAANFGGDWRMVILGGGPERAALEAQAEHLQIADRVEFRGSVASVEMPAQYHDIDVLALPSLTRPNWKEQFGRVLVEAMASGIPVIGSNSGAIPGVIGDTGLIVPESDVPALTDALSNLGEDSTLYAELASKGRARALAEYSHEGVAEKTVALYQELVSQ